MVRPQQPIGEQHEQARPRRRFRYGMRTLLVCIVCVAIPLAWRTNRVWKQRTIRTEVALAGGRVCYDWETNASERDGYDRLTGLPIKPTNWAWLRSAIGDDYFDTITGAEFWFCRPPAHVIERVSSLPGVEYLQVNSDDAIDDDLAAVANMRHLITLECDSASVTDAGIVRILDALPKLQLLTLRCSQLTDRSLASIARLDNLIFLELDGIGNTDAGVKHLPKTSKLELLYLDHTDLGDSGLMHLAGLENLVQLRMVGTRVTTAGVSAFKKAKPDCVCTSVDPVSK